MKFYFTTFATDKEPATDAFLKADVVYEYTFRTMHRPVAGK